MVVVGDEPLPAGLPDGSTACQVPPKLATPTPFAVPLVVSPENVYSGHPPYVTYSSPLDERTVPSSDPSIPVPATALVTPLGSSTGGQNLVQPLSSVHVIFPPFSELSRYSVRPFPLTRTVPALPTTCADTVYAAAEPVEAGDDAAAADVADDAPDEPDDAVWVDDPHDAATTATPNAAIRPAFADRKVRTVESLMQWIRPAWRAGLHGGEPSGWG